MRCKHQGGFFRTDGRHDFFDRARRPGRLAAFTNAARLHHDRIAGDMAHIENLRPAVAEPAVANDQHLFTGSELARNRLHAKGAAARNQHRAACVIDLF